MRIFPDIPAAEIKEAAHKGWEEMAAVHKDVEKKGEETLQYLKETGRRGIVLAGRPYHIDPEIHHGIPDLINSYGVAVLTEDSVSHLVPVERPDPCKRPVDVPFQTVRSCKLCQDKRMIWT